MTSLLSGRTVSVHFPDYYPDWLTVEKIGPLQYQMNGGPGYELLRELERRAQVTFEFGIESVEDEAAWDLPAVPWAWLRSRTTHFDFCGD